MPYQYVREPLTADESDRQSNACETPTERLVVWTLLDTGLRVGELCGLTSKDILWQQRQLRFKGKGGSHGKRTKVRAVPMSNRVRTLLEHHFADVGEARFWRMDPAANHGAMNGLARHRVNTELIARNWDDMLRVVGLLARGTISASELIGSLLRSSRPSTLTRAIGELGRVAKTLYLLSYLDDET